MNLHVLWTTCDDLTTGLKCYADRGCLSQKWTLPCSTCYKGECVIFTWKAKYWAISPRSRFFRYRRCKHWSHTLFREVIRNFQCQFSNDVSLGPKWWPIIRRDLWRFICGKNVPGPLVYGEYLSETSLMQLNPGNPPWPQSKYNKTSIFHSVEYCYANGTMRKNGWKRFLWMITKDFVHWLKTQNYSIPL